MTSSDAPQPPGGPLRQDAPAGDFAPDGQREDLPEADGAAGGADDVPPVSREPDTGEPDSGEPDSGEPDSGEPEQSDADAAVQEENAETSLDQPSS